MNINSVQPGASITSTSSVYQKEKDEEKAESTNKCTPQVDSFTSEKVEESAGIYHLTSDGGVAFDAPTQQQAYSSGQAMNAGQSSGSSNDNDDTLENLEEQKEQLEEQIAQTTDEDEKAALEQELLQIESEISSYQSESLQSSSV